jgi:hypothetical protein
MNYFVTGCDKNTEWQLPWFTKNFHKHCDDELVIADFGLSPEGKKFAKENCNFVVGVQSNGWFSKVETMWKMKHWFQGKYCWVDTDCEIMADPSGIFNYVEHNKLTAVIDHPWTANGSPWTPQGNCGPWYNTGVVAFEGRPIILEHWFNEVKKEGIHRGDQEALYWLLNQDAMNRVIHISEAPHRFNVLRLDILQERVPSKQIIKHWTGQKGKEEIRRQLNHD